MSFSHLQPYKVFLSGAGYFHYTYTQKPSAVEVEPQLSRVMFPSGVTREFKASTALDTQQLMVFPWLPAQITGLTYQWTADASVPQKFHFSRLVWPSGSRQLTVCDAGRYVFHDRVSQLRETSPDLDTVYLTDEEQGFKLYMEERQKQGLLPVETFYQFSLVAAHRTINPGSIFGELFSLKNAYFYNAALRVEKCTSLLFWTRHFSRRTVDFHSSSVDESPIALSLSLESEVYPDSGLLAKLDQFVFKYMQPLTTETRLLNTEAKIMSTFDSNWRLLKRTLVTKPVFADGTESTRDMEIFKLSNNFDSSFAEATTSQLFLTLSGSTANSDFLSIRTKTEFGPGGRPTRISRRLTGHHSSDTSRDLFYTSDGKLHRVSTRNGDKEAEATSSMYDSRGMLDQLGNWKYLFDDDGFLLYKKRRTSDNSYSFDIMDEFSYSSKGLLKEAKRVLYKPETSSEKSFRVQYNYDHLDRIILMRNLMSIRELLQFHYTNPEQPHQVTMMIDYGEQFVYRYLYEPRSNHLFAIQRFGLSAPHLNSTGRSTSSLPDTFIVMSNHQGTPIAVYDSSNKVINHRF
ncbi:Teneurin-2 [Cichlidogyrus casuarinus]|uniref:Teneurin-2 n=1 Tax=Cichlidogyrus casuarinus TaxID=1844966 RepID=A0ABD2PWR3_9PLAT